MVRGRDKLLVVAAAFVVLVALGSPAIAWDVQEKVTNNIGRPAEDLTKIVIGHGQVTGAITNQLGAPSITTHTSVSGGGSVSIVHWGPGGPPVNPGEWIWGCFNSSGRPQVITALWTDGAGNYIGLAAVEAHFNATWSADGRVRLDVQHSWREWNGTHYPPEPGDWYGEPLGPVTAREVFWGVSDCMRPLDELNDELIESGVIEWMPLPEFVLDGEGSVVTFELGPVNPDQVVLVRSVLEGEGLITPTIHQFRVSEIME